MELLYALHLDGGQDVRAGGARHALPTFSQEHVGCALECARLLKGAAPAELVTIVLWPDDARESGVARTGRDALDAFGRLGALARALEREELEASFPSLDAEGSG